MHDPLSSLSDTSSQSSAQERIAALVKTLTEGIRAGLFLPTFSDANALLAAREKKGRATPRTELPTDPNLDNMSKHGFHLVTSAILKGEYDPHADKGFSDLISAINRELDQELRTQSKGGMRPR